MIDGVDHGVPSAGGDAGGADKEQTRIEQQLDNLDERIAALEQEQHESKLP